MTASVEGPAAAAVRASRQEGVATIVVNNPPVNAMSDEVLQGLDGSLAELARDDSVRAVVLAGSGERAFLAGADLNELKEMVADTSLARQHVALTGRLFARIAALPQPLVAAADGSALGGGFEVLLACDLAVVAETARLGFPEVGLGLIPGAGGTQRLARSVGVKRALHLILSQDLLTANRAAELGLVTEVAERGGALERAGELASRLAALPAVAVQSAKRVIRAGSELPLEEALGLESEHFLALFETEDVREGVSAFLDKRPPTFSHR